jgi:hypothetical protein
MVYICSSPCLRRVVLYPVVFIQCTNLEENRERLEVPTWPCAEGGMESGGRNCGAIQSVDLLDAVCSRKSFVALNDRRKRCEVRRPVEFIFVLSSI